MKLIKLTLHGQYKGLNNQTFDFAHCESNILAFAGLNGAGKSQLLELICESFNWLERYNRNDFLVRNSWKGFRVDLTYQLTVDFDTLFKTSQLKQYQYQVLIEHNNDIFESGKTDYLIQLHHLGSLPMYVVTNLATDKGIILKEHFPIPLPTHILAYASGLNENLQLSFLRTSLKYAQAMQAKRYFSQQFNNHPSGISPDLERVIYDHSNKPYPNTAPIEKYLNPNAAISIFDYDDNNGFSLKDTQLPMGVFLDYDCNALIMVCLAMLSPQQRQQLFPQVRFRHPVIIELDYDLSNVPYADDAINDLLQLIDIIGRETVEELPPMTISFNNTPLPYLSGRIKLDVSQASVHGELKDTYFNQPLSLFKKLYKIQLLGASQWRDNDIKKLSDDNCFDHVKKPLKGHLPLAVNLLTLTDDQYSNTITFDDLSDGEAQLIQIIGAAFMFSDENTLMIFDEPETHLNPNWRTGFHQRLKTAIGLNTTTANTQVQTFISTHSPFLLSSLHKQNILHFERKDNQIKMHPAALDTYGASFESIIKQFFELDSMISQTAVDEIKQYLERGNNQQTKQWIEDNLADSMEKAYLLKRLEL